MQLKIGEGQVYPACFHENEGEPACALEIVPEDITAVWWNIRGCPCNQMAEVEARSASQTIALKLLRGLLFLVFGPPAFVLALVFSLLCCCCAPCTKLFDTTYRNAFTTCLASALGDVLQARRGGGGDNVRRDFECMLKTGAYAVSIILGKARARGATLSPDINLAGKRVVGATYMDKTLDRDVNAALNILDVFTAETLRSE
ncbi:hypothetical protein Gpo141_00013785 [Globisporangium polare]